MHMHATNVPTEIRRLKAVIEAHTRQSADILRARAAAEANAELLIEALQKAQLRIAELETAAAERLQPVLPTPPAA